MTEPFDPATTEGIAPDSAEAEDIDQLAATSEDEYPRQADDEPGEVSIDDALETDRVVAEGAESRNADGYGFDADLERGTDDSAAAEQGNRAEDRMEVDDGDDEELEQIAGADGDAAGTERDLADPEV